MVPKKLPIWEEKAVDFSALVSRGDVGSDKKKKAGEGLLAEQHTEISPHLNHAANNFTWDY